MFPIGRPTVHRHSWVPILAILFAACTTAGGSPAPSTTTTSSSTSSTTTSTLPPTTTTLPPTTTTTVARTAVVPPAGSGAPTAPRATACPPEIVNLIHEYWDRFGPEVVEWAIGIAWRESNCRPDVASPTGCYSIFQMALPLHKGFYAAAGYPDWYSARYDARASVAAAALLYAGSGSSPWRL